MKKFAIVVAIITMFALIVTVASAEINKYSNGCTASVIVKIDEEGQTILNTPFCGVWVTSIQHDMPENTRVYLEFEGGEIVKIEPYSFELIAEYNANH